MSDPSKRSSCLVKILTNLNIFVKLNNVIKSLCNMLRNACCAARVIGQSLGESTRIGVLVSVPPFLFLCRKHTKGIRIDKF